LAIFVPNTIFFMRRSYFLLLSVLCLFLSSCNMFGERIHGNGNVKSVTRQADHFSSVSVRSNINLHIKQDSSWSVRIEADENLLELIETEVHGGLLEIKVAKSYELEPSRSINVFVTAPEFTGLRASGSSEIQSDSKITTEGTLDIHISGASSITLDLKSPRVEAELSGASKATLRGETKDFSLRGSGASEFMCFELMAENTDVNVSGASNGDVFASIKLEADASGASNVRYKGNPTVNSNTSGAGSVNRSN
jgi:hypothetical protein